MMYIHVHVISSPITCTVNEFKFNRGRKTKHLMTYLSSK